MGELKRVISFSTSLSVAASIASSTALSVATPDLAHPVEPDYVNPLESSSRWYLTARASAVRYAASLGFGIANRSEPAAPSPSRQVWLDFHPVAVERPPKDQN